jgi:HAD superfamily hydrolase (TIGR01490 family)
MRERIAFFDVDHTITSGSTGRRFAEMAVLQGILKLRHLALIPFSYAVYRFGGGGASIFEGEFPVIKGVDGKMLEELAREVFDKRTKAAVRPRMLALIASIKEEGGEIVLATSSLDFIVRPLAALLGADALLASALEYDESGRCTGRLAGKALFGAEKRDAAAAYAASRGARLSECSFYSDSIHDLPLLLEAGKPVAVAPDRRLAREARLRGWEVLRF